MKIKKRKKKEGKKHNLKQQYIPDPTYKILITGDSGSGKTSALLTLRNN